MNRSPSAMSGTAFARGEPESPKSGPITVAWVFLWVLVAFLLVIATLLFVRTGLLGKGELTAAQVKSVWAFLGVALGVVATLVATILTEQNNRRMSKSAELQAARQYALARETENRLSFDTAAKVVELIEGRDAEGQKARMAAAVATMVQLGNTPVAIRIVDELWDADKVDSGTAVWAIEQIFQGDTVPDVEKEQAAELLFVNCTKLIPVRGAGQQTLYEWPKPLTDIWGKLPAGAKNILIATSLKVLLSRELDYWTELLGSVFPVQTLVLALEDEQHAERDVAGPAAGVLEQLLKAGVLESLGVMPTEEMTDRILRFSANLKPSPWFARLLAQIKPWAEDRQTPQVADAPPAPFGPDHVLAGESLLEKNLLP